MKLYRNQIAALPIMTALMILLVAGFAPVVPARAGAWPAAGSVAPARSVTLLPGDAALALAAGNQDMPQIAAGGPGYLVVWEDARTNYAGVLEGVLPDGGQVSGQTLRDIYAARLDAAGQLLDSTPIVVTQAARSQTRPQVAWNGQLWLVVWNTERRAGTTTTKDVLAARVSPQGVLLDSTPILIDGSDGIDELTPVVASDGTNWVVAWKDEDSSSKLNAARVAPGGAVLDPAGVAVVSAQFPDIPINPRLVFAGDEFLIVWSANNRIKGLRFDAALQPLGAIFTVSSFGNFPDVGSDGTDFFVAWQQANSVYGTRVTHAGQVLDPGGLDLAGSHGGFPYPEVAWDGTQWVATWVATNGTAYAARITPGGILRDPGGFVVAPNTRISSIAGASGGVRMVWADQAAGGPGRADIAGAAIAADGTVGPTVPLALGAPSQRQLRLVPNGSGYLAVFLSEVAGEVRIKGQRLDATGAALDMEPFLIAGGAVTLRNPAAAWNGLHYLVVWENNNAIYGRRVAPDGTVLDPTPIAVLPGNTPDVAALGTTFLVVDTHEPVNHIRYAKAVRVDDTGAVLGTPVTIGGSFATGIRVAAFGNRWLAAWQHQLTHDAPHVSIYGGFVNPDGTGVGEFTVVGTAFNVYLTPALAMGPAQGLIAYYVRDEATVQDGNIRARRILPDGTLLDNDPGIPVTGAPGAQFSPAAAWDGAEYIIAYEDYRHVPALELPISDIYATRVDGNGVVLDPAGVAIAADAGPDVLPAVAARPGSYLAGYSDFRDDRPHAAYRVTVQHYPAGTLPTATPAPPTTTPGPPSATPIPPTGTPVPPSATPIPPTGTVIPPSATVPPATGTPGPPSVTVPPATTTPCALTFNDVDANHPFYPFIRCLACRGILSGYADGTFRPYADVTRGQLAKILANAAQFNDGIASTQQTFTDVPNTHAFWLWIERLGAHGAISGYTCGSPGEPCDPQQRPYFRPYSNATRGQIAKITAIAAQVQDPVPPNRQTFTDVPPGQPFWRWIEQLAGRAIVNGYGCGGAGEPCDPQSRPYFRPGNPTTRGQLAKIAANMFYPNCPTPAAR
jgi:hypothetical protein